MTEIRINIEVLDEKIAKLKTLQEDCDRIYMCDEDVIGSGQSTELVKDIRGEYKVIKDTMSALYQILSAFLME